MRSCAWRVIAVLCAATLGRSLPAQSSSLAGTIVARETGERLGYAVVDVGGQGRAQFANDSGAFFFGDLATAVVSLRVRRLGYQPLDTSIVLDRGATTNVRIALERVAVRLREVTVSSMPPCKKPGAPKKNDTTLYGVFTQLRMNAEQYRLLTEKHPLHYLLHVELSRRLKSDGSVTLDSSMEQRIDAAPKWRYKPGNVVTRQGPGWFVHLPVLVDFADKSFIEHHCFHYAGRSVVGSDSLIRLEVVASERLRSFDVSGSIFLDPVNFQIRRTRLELTLPWGRFGDVVEFRMTSEFQEILPSISILSRVDAVQRMDPGITRLDHDEAYETQILQAYQFLKTRPGVDEKPRRKS